MVVHGGINTCTSTKSSHSADHHLYLLLIYKISSKPFGLDTMPVTLSTLPSVFSCYSQALLSGTMLRHHYFPSSLPLLLLVLLPAVSFPPLSCQCPLPARLAEQGSFLWDPQPGSTPLLLLNCIPANLVAVFPAGR